MNGALAAALLLAPVQEPEEDLRPRIDAVADRALQSGRFVGLVVGIRHAPHSRIFGYGRLSDQNGAPPDGRTLFEIGSITKVFTGLLLACLVREGRVKLEDPIGKHLPPGVRAPSGEGREITLLDLATHRSGLPRLPSNFAPRDARNPYADYREQDLLDFLASARLDREPGEAYEYSNLGAGLLGYLLARAGGRSYEDLVVDRICRPLRMGDTRVAVGAADRARLAPGHASARDAVSAWDFDALAGAGALRSTAEDLLRFAEAHFGQAPGGLGAALEEACRPRARLGTGAGEVGLGWHRAPLPGRRTLLWHNGRTGGHASFLGVVPEAGTAVVVLSNASSPVDEIARRILDEALRPR